MTHISGNLKPIMDLAVKSYDTAIKRMRAIKKSRWNPLQNIVPDVAEMAPTEDDIKGTLAGIVALSDLKNPTARMLAAKGMVEDAKGFAKDPLKTVIENPVSSALNLIPTAAVAREASYSSKIPIASRQYLRAMAHIPTTHTRLPKQHIKGLLDDIKEVLASKEAYSRTSIEPAKKIVHDFMGPPVEELIKRGQITPETKLAMSLGPSKSQLYNVLGKYYFEVDPEKNIIHVRDLYKFYPWLDAKEPIIKNLRRRIGGILKSKNTNYIDKMKNVINILSDTRYLEILGIRYGGEYPIHWKLESTPEINQLWNSKLSMQRLKELEAIPTTKLTKEQNLEMDELFKQKYGKSYAEYQAEYDKKGTGESYAGSFDYPDYALPDHMMEFKGTGKKINELKELLGPDGFNHYVESVAGDVGHEYWSTLPKQKKVKFLKGLADIQGGADYLDEIAKIKNSLSGTSDLKSKTSIVAALDDLYLSKAKWDEVGEDTKKLTLEEFKAKYIPLLESEP